MINISEEFESNYEDFKNRSANSIRCLIDLGDEEALRIYKDTDLVGFVLKGKVFIDTDYIDVLAVNDNQNLEEEE